MRAYKLTDENDQTHGGTQWGPGITHTAALPGPGDLCSGHYIHCYSDPLVAAFMNPLHANFAHPRLWIVEADGKMIDDMGLKFGAKTVTTIRVIDLPEITTVQHVSAAIYLAYAALEMTGQTIPLWEVWADDWLSGRDRSRYAASDAAGHAANLGSNANYASDAASHAANHASHAANYASHAASHAANYASHAASHAANYASDASNASYAASYASYAANYASDAASGGRAADEFPSLLLICLYAAMG